MKKLIIPILIIVLGVTGFLIFKGQTKKEKISPPKIETKMPETKGKKAVMLIAFRDFRDEEYFVTKEILEKAGIEIKTASNKMGRAIGKFGGDTEVDLLVSQINVSDFDAIIFVGGPGCLDALDNEESYRIAREAVSQNKVLAAICISPVILARAGVLRGKRATVWNDFVKSQAKILKREGAIFEDKPVVVDGKIVTANGPEAAKDFGEAILSLLK
jgi:protease I